MIWGTISNEMPWAINEYLTRYFHSDTLLRLLLFFFSVSACWLERIYVGSLILHTKYLWDLQLIRFLPVADKLGSLSTPSPQMYNLLFHPVFVRNLNATWWINIIINSTAFFLIVSIFTCLFRDTRVPGLIPYLWICLPHFTSKVLVTLSSVTKWLPCCFQIG